MVKDFYLISDAAKMVDVESHVLRYWEEELRLPIKRNEMGHRYYTEKDVERFREIKELKEQGLQLKAIRMILKDGKLSVEIPDSRDKIEKVLPSISKESDSKNVDLKKSNLSGHEIVNNKSINLEGISKEEKARRLQWLLQQMISQTLKENNEVLCQDIRESVVKELDYQFRIQEEKTEVREKERTKHQDEHYQKLDELIRLRSKKKGLKGDAEQEKKEKRKRHSFF